MNTSDRTIEASGCDIHGGRNRRERRRAELGDESFRHNSYQWDIVTTDGHFFKSGFGGQGLYIAPEQDLVIAWFGTDDERGYTEMLTVARQLAVSGIF